ncbi:MAG: subclass B3 metallo-beta-lactamase [Pseudomonadota bacterium]
MDETERAVEAVVPIPASDEAFTARGIDPNSRYGALYRSWLEPVAPFRIAGPLHFVGTKGLGMFFLPTEDGHIVIDGGLPETGTMVADSIRQLGYDPADIRILLNTHAHFDHSGGLAELKRLSGATLLASEGDRSALETGTYLGSEDDAALAAPPVAVDRLLADGDVVTLGGISLTAHLTPGHSRGCTSWTLALDEGDETYSALILCSVTVAGNRLVDPPQYEGIVEAYRTTFTKLRDWRPDIFLSNHNDVYGLVDKRAALADGDPLAFVERARFPAYISRLEAAFESTLADRKAAAGDASD